MDKKNLLCLAEQARRNAYGPYSGFTVGAALLCRNGKVYCGCNVENASFTPTCCAERVAIFKAVSEGERDFQAIAVVGGRGENAKPLCAPCGVCRQVLAEFCGEDFKVILEDGNGEPVQLSLADLLPHRFRL